MQTFVIEGGRRLSGRVRAAGNKNGALPILAACLLTDEPVTLDERAAHPRRRDDARAARRHRAPTRSGPGRTRCASTRPTSIKTELDEELCTGSAPRSCSPARCSRAAGRADRAAARRRRDRPPPARHAHPRARALGAEIDADAPLRACAPTRLAGEPLFLDEASVTGTENAVMAAVLADGRDRDRERGLRAARPGSLPLPRLARRARSTASARTCSASRASSGSTAASTGSAPSTSRSRASSASRRSPAAT